MSSVLQRSTLRWINGRNSPHVFIRAIMLRQAAGLQNQTSPGYPTQTRVFSCKSVTLRWNTEDSEKDCQIIKSLWGTSCWILPEECSTLKSLVFGVICAAEYSHSGKKNTARRNGKRKTLRCITLKIMISQHEFPTKVTFCCVRCLCLPNVM